MTESRKAKIIKLRAAGKGYRVIASTLGIPVNTVKSFCIRNHINAETAPGLAASLPTETSLCDNCGKEIQQMPKRKKKRFCSDKCRNRWWNSHLSLVKRKANYTFVCQHCGKEFSVYGDRRRKYCSHECYIAARFKGGDRND